jgi:SAM-dependent methyltransferase
MKCFVFPKRGASLFRGYQNKFLREYTRDLPVSTVMNLGAKPDAPDKEGSTYERYFPNATFLTLDLADKNHPRHRQVDLMAVPSDVGQYDLVLAMSVIEHIDRPWKAAPGITSLVKPGGHLYIAMPFFYPVHEGPYFGDHWRATPSAMTFLFEELSEVRADYYPSSLLAVRDRTTYWREPNSSYAGFSMLMQKPAT